MAQPAPHRWPAQHWPGQPAPQMGYPQQPGYGQVQVPPARRSRRRGKTLGIVLAVVGGFVILCGGAGGAGYLAFFHTAGDPEQLVVEFDSAAQRQDCEAIVDLTTRQTWSGLFDADTRDEAVAECRTADDDILGLAVGLPDNGERRLDGTRLTSQDRTTTVVEATYTVTYPATGTTTVPVEYTLFREDRNWRIDLTGLPQLPFGF